MRVASSMTDLIGGTPLLQLNRMFPDCCVLAKLECFNPAGSAKDRAALYMIAAAESAGHLRADSVIIEPTSGNTGIGLAAVAVPKGYRVILTMPESMSEERRALLRAYGAELVLTPAGEGMAGAIRKAEQLAAEIPHSFIPGQFDNPANPAVHTKTTGPEIWEDTEGNVDIFVAGAGTGGTVSGVGRYLKEKNPAVRVVAVEPFSSPVLSGGKAGPHGLQGIGAGFVPSIMDISLLDDVVCVKESDAYETCRKVAGTEGILIGISGGAALWAATQLAKKEENKGKKIVVICPDSGERYLSLPLFE